jgi:exonuclease III
MKLISLNTWGGRGGKDRLLDFFDTNKEVDIFCLQEVWSDSYAHLGVYKAGNVDMDDMNEKNIMIYGLQDISGLLIDHTPYFRPHFLDHYGLLILINKNIQVIDEGEAWVYKHKGYMPEGDAGRHARNIQYVTFKTPSGIKTVINFHGLWNGEGKNDSHERVEQSEKIVAYLKTLENPYILAGDFNLNPTTQSINLLEAHGMRNLIKEYGYTSTRTPLYEKEGKFADYVFVSGDLRMIDFSVLPDVVSDHSPLYLDFS